MYENPAKNPDEWDRAVEYIRANFQLYRRFKEVHDDLTKLISYLEPEWTKEEEEEILALIFADDWEGIQEWRIKNRQRLTDAHFAFKREMIAAYRRRLSCRRQ